MSVFSCKRPYL